MNFSSPNLEAQKQRWLDWFGGLGQAQAEKQFVTWLQLVQRQAQLKTIVNNTRLNLSVVEADLETAASKLMYDKPYRIVVIGESGAGKSTLINAILQRDLLASETGGAVTGTAAYILPNSNESRDRVRFEWRSDREFAKLLKELASRYKVQLSQPNEIIEPITPQQIFKLLNDKALSPPDDVPDRIRNQLPEELRDIAATWNRLLTSKVNKISGLDLSQKNELDQILMEASSLNRDERTRIIPGIKYAEYHLAADENTAVNSALKHVVLVDTPGVGATILRHYEILRQEVKQADAVILVVGAKRPGAYAEEMAYLIQSVLFEGYSAEARDQFASKVFLVVNQADELLGGRGNRGLLEQSITRIGKIIAPDYEKRYGKASSNCRYFETMALLSFLSTQASQGKELQEDDRKLYDSQMSLLGEKAETVNSAQMNQKSQVPALTDQLTRFLCEQRVDLTLAEAEYALKRVEDKLWLTCQEVLAKHGIDLERGKLSNVEGLHTIYLRQVCQGILEQASDELKEQQKDLLISMDKWRESDLHQRQVNVVTQAIFNDLKTKMDSHLSSLLNPDAKEGRVRESRDDAEGRNYRGIVPEEILLEAQRRFRRTIEEQSQQLSGYYVSKLQTEIISQRLYDLLNEKCYGQVYANDLDPAGEMERELQRVKTEFESICRWVLVYEVLKMPILLPPGKPGDHAVVQKAFERAIDTVRDSVPDSAPGLAKVGIGAIREIVNQMVPPPLQEFVHAIAAVAHQTITPTIDSVPSDNPMPPPTDPVSEQAQQLLDMEQLKNEIDRLMAEDDRQEVARLIQQQFALRYNLAIGASLIFVEKLFFYLLEQYRYRLKEVADELIKRHENYLGAGTLEIQNRLLAEHSSQREEVIQAINCLKQLEQPNRKEVSAPVSQAA